MMVMDIFSRVVQDSESQLSGSVVVAKDIGKITTVGTFLSVYMALDWWFLAFKSMVKGVVVRDQVTYYSWFLSAMRLFQKSGDLASYTTILFLLVHWHSMDCAKILDPLISKKSQVRISLG